MSSITVTKHAVQRIQQRNNTVNSTAMAKRNAKIAFHSGLTISKIDHDHSKLAAWMRHKKEKNGNQARVRLYQNNLYIWKGNKKLVTVIPVPKSLRLEEGQDEALQAENEADGAVS